jgi:hypothetical protein
MDPLRIKQHRRFLVRSIISLGFAGLGDGLTASGVFVVRG